MIQRKPAIRAENSMMFVSRSTRLEIRSIICVSIDGAATGRGAASLNFSPSKNIIAQSFLAYFVGLLCLSAGSIYNFN